MGDRIDIYAVPFPGDTGENCFKFDTGKVERAYCWWTVTFERTTKNPWFVDDAICYLRYCYDIRGYLVRLTTLW